MDNKAFNYYINWTLYAIYGQMAAADSLLPTHKEHIYRGADCFRKEFGTPISPLYRGVIVNDEHVNDGLIRCQERVEYISFSADKNVAYWFADRDSIMSHLVSMQHPKAKGYVIQFTPDVNDILYHHKWPLTATLIKAAMLHPDIDPSQFHWNITTQKEVMIKPVNTPMKADLYVSSVSAEALDNMLCHPQFRAMYR